MNTNLFHPFIPQYSHRVVSDIQHPAFRSSLYIRYNMAAHIVHKPSVGKVTLQIHQYFT